MKQLGQKVKSLWEFSQLHKHFQNYFRVVPAVNDDLVRKAQGIRHEVYCEELGWEETNAEKLEADEFDAQSLHCLLKSVGREKYVGCIRLVLPDPSKADSRLPFQITCGDGLESGHPDPQAILRGEVAEVSRLAITADYRRRRHEKGKPVAIADARNITEERRKFPYIPVALYLGMLEMAHRNNIKTLYILTEPLLAKHFSRLGGRLKAVGEGVEHRGIRVPYCMDVEEILSGARFVLRPLIRTIRNDVRAQMDAAEALNSEHDS